MGSSPAVSFGFFRAPTRFNKNVLGCRIMLDVGISVFEGLCSPASGLRSVETCSKIQTFDQCRLVQMWDDSHDLDLNPARMSVSSYGPFK